MHTKFDVVPWLAKAAVIIFAAVPGFSAAQSQDDDEIDDGKPGKWIVWDSVERIRGQATIEHDNWDNRDDGVYTEKNKTTDHVVLDFELERVPRIHHDGDTRWRGIKVTVRGSTKSSSVSSSKNHRITHTASGEFSQDIKSDPLSLTIHHRSGEFELHLPGSLDQPAVEYRLRSEWRYMGGNATNEKSEGKIWTFPSQVVSGIAPSRVSEINKSQKSEHTDEDGGGGDTRVARVILWPDYVDVKLTVNLRGTDHRGKEVAYEDWRPWGSIRNPRSPGNKLEILAKIRPVEESESKFVAPEVDHFRFELVDTSREPGVMMNWPLAATDRDVDMRLAMETTNPGRLSSDDQLLEVAQYYIDAAGRPTAAARVESFDFGGRSELKITAQLKDGRTLYGRLWTDATEFNSILLPKRKPGGWIADSWLAHKNLSGTPDDDDSENTPAGDGDTGDGLTLYEEYRGFAARGMRLGRAEGDPTRKDLFVLNLIGADARSGIRRFEQMTGLRVVHKLDRSELDPEVRVINGNHAEAPQRVQQHGIVLRTIGTKLWNNSVEGKLMRSKADDPHALKPRTTRYVPMPVRQDAASTVNTSEHQTRDSKFSTYDWMLVHEMLHAVSVVHHGYGDRWVDLTYLPADYKGNASGRRQILMSSEDGDKYVDLRSDRFGDLYQDYLVGESTDRLLNSLARKKFKSTFADLDRYSQSQLINSFASFTRMVGVESGQHSGDEDCPMRFFSADLYPAKGLVRTPEGKRATGVETYYFFSLFNQRKSMSDPWGLCETDMGTGYNAPWEDDPQPRFGNAMTGRGKCAAQICVNDAVAPHNPGLRP